jgi:hypothetical protein
MFAWYRDSAICYVYLDIDTDAEYLTAEDFKTCRWTYRGWTLQELIAPSRLRFYSRFWLFLGTRQQLAQALHETTKIHISVLYRFDGEPLDLTSHCVARKMSWAAERQTTRPEDIAYAMFGLFGVHLSPLYGEGSEKAFLRLQYEILKSSRDLSILAWTTDDTYHYDEGALALTPNWFTGCETIITFPSPTGDTLVSTDNGLSVTVPVVEDPGQWTYTAMLNCRYENDSFMELGITLFSVALHGNTTYSRKTVWAAGKSETSLCRMDPDTLSNVQWKTIRITKRDQLIAATQRVKLFKFKVDSDFATRELSDKLAIVVPQTIGFWNLDDYPLEISEEQLEVMDICPTIWLLRREERVPLFTLSLGRDLSVYGSYLVSRRGPGHRAQKLNRRSAILIIDGASLLVRVSVTDKGFSRGRHVLEVLLRFDHHPPGAQIISLSHLDSSQEDPYTRKPRFINVGIKKVSKNILASLNHGPNLQILD